WAAKAAIPASKMASCWASVSFFIVSLLPLGVLGHIERPLQDGVGLGKGRGLGMRLRKAPCPAALHQELLHGFGVLQGISGTEGAKALYQHGVGRNQRRR